MKLKARHQIILGMTMAPIQPGEVFDLSDEKLTKELLDRDAAEKIEGDDAKGPVRNMGAEMKKDQEQADRNVAEARQAAAFKGAASVGTLPAARPAVPVSAVGVQRPPVPPAAPAAGDDGL